jgi:beta-glucosidase
VLFAWLPGQEFGSALADVLLGGSEPGGRLPMTMPAAEADCPVLHARPAADGTLDYTEGLLIGYRGYDAADVTPAYSFGSGLGYTSWDYESVDCPPWLREDADLELTVRIRNAGTRAGKEVVQAYLAEPGDPCERGSAAASRRSGRPVRVLAAFAVARAEPGKSADVGLVIPARMFARYDESLARWVVPSGEFTVQVGRSSRDLPLAVRVRISALRPRGLAAAGQPATARMVRSPRRCGRRPQA